MPYTMAFDQEGSYLTVIHTGLVTLDELERGRIEATQRLQDANCLRMMVNLLGKQQELSAFDLYRFNVGNAAALPPLLRVAVLHRPEHRREADYMAELAQRSGINLNVFTQHDLAIEWLLSGQRLSDLPLA
ncbi:MAG: hypothetical protein EPO01_09940 [Aquabacterium sp.]|nr:MAG: hypothetical protein EPO01_09940 [Aquabacterium sp.]